MKLPSAPPPGRETGRSPARRPLTPAVRCHRQLAASSEGPTQRAERAAEPLRYQPGVERDSNHGSHLSGQVPAVISRPRRMPTQEKARAGRRTRSTAQRTRAACISLSVCGAAGGGGGGAAPAAACSAMTRKRSREVPPSCALSEPTSAHVRITKSICHAAIKPSVQLLKRSVCISLCSARRRTSRGSLSKKVLTSAAVRPAYLVEKCPPS